MRMWWKWKYLPRLSHLYIVVPSFFVPCWIFGLIFLIMVIKFALLKLWYTGAPRQIWARQGPIFYPNFFYQLFLIKEYWNPKSRKGPGLWGLASRGAPDIIAVCLRNCLSFRFTLRCNTFSVWCFQSHCCCNW